MRKSLSLTNDSSITAPLCRRVQKDRCSGESCYPFAPSKTELRLRYSDPDAYLLPAAS